MKQERSCGAVVYSQQDKTILYLLIQHVNGAHWSFPKGHVEPDETDEETALREIQEETGLTVELDTTFKAVNHYQPSQNSIKDVIYFIGYASDLATTAQEEEVTTMAWLPFDQAIDLLTYKTDRDILIQAQQHLLK